MGMIIMMMITYVVAFFSLKQSNRILVMFSKANGSLIHGGTTHTFEWRRYSGAVLALSDNLSNASHRSCDSVESRSILHQRRAPALLACWNYPDDGSALAVRIQLRNKIAIEPLTAPIVHHFAQLPTTEVFPSRIKDQVHRQVL